VHHCFDVLVVGAGPAGSSAAFHLAHQGADVLLVDRFAFPRDKRCGDGIVTAALEELALMGIADEVQARYSASSHIALWLYGIQTITACTAGKHFTTGYVAPRISFDALLVHVVCCTPVHDFVTQFGRSLLAERRTQETAPEGKLTLVLPVFTGVARQRWLPNLGKYVLDRCGLLVGYHK
jgi:FAD binding domain